MRNLVRMVLIVFHVELFFQAIVKHVGESWRGMGFPGMLASVSKPICGGLIQKTIYETVR